MRVTNLIVGNFLWILPLNLIYHAVECDLWQNSGSLISQDESKSRVIFTNVSFPRNPIPTFPNSYYDFICRSEFFVDNSPLIEYVEEKQKVAILLPRRFGKTLNLLMIKCFHEIPVECVNETCKPVSREETEAYQIFEKGLLTNCPKNNIVKLQQDLRIKSLDDGIMEEMNKQPVLYINFKKMGLHTNDLHRIYDYIIGEIFLTYRQYKYLEYNSPEFKKYYDKLNNPPEDKKSRSQLILNAVKMLTSMLEMFFDKPVMLLIDEYDSILNTAFLNENQASEPDKNELVRFFSEFYGGLLKDNPCISKAVLTGIIPWKNADILSSLSYVATSTVMQDYPTYCYGISDIDLHAMHTYFTNKYNKSLDTELELKNYYDGYLFGYSNLKRYNPYSISCYFNSNLIPRLQPYWSETGDASGLLRQLMKYLNFAESFLALLLPDGAVEIKTPDSSILSLNAMRAISKMIENATNLPTEQWYNTSIEDQCHRFALLYLYTTGYFTKKSSSTTTLLILEIPNQEVRNELWKNYYNVLTNIDDPGTNIKYRAAIEKFAPILGEILKSDQTDCSDLNNYFQLALAELPDFTKTPRVGEGSYYYASDAQIESIMSGVLDWWYNRLSREQQHGFKKSMNYPHQRMEGRPDLAVIHDKSSLTVFEFKLDGKFDDAYKQGMKYVHFYFLRSEYYEINQIKVIPFVIYMNKTVMSNATVCARDTYNATLDIRNNLTFIQKRIDISPPCYATCASMLDWTWAEHYCIPNHDEFQFWRTKVIEDCDDQLTDKTSYYFPKKVVVIKI